MKRIIYVVMLMVTSVAISQSEPYVIDVVENKNVFLYFPSPIEKALSGNPNYSFGYDRKKAEKFGVLTATGKSEESTLHVITKDEKVYSFIIKHNPKVSKFDHFFNESHSLGSMANEVEKPVEKDVSSSEKTDVGKKIVESSYFDESLKSDNADISFSKELIAKGDYYKKFSRKNSDIVLRLSNIAYKGDKSFVFLTIHNESTLDYNVNFIQFNKTAKKTNKKSTYQSIEVKSLSNFQGFDKIPAGETKTAVYIFEKITIDKNTVINIELNELKGDRNIKLPVGHKYINNPNN